MHLQCCTTVYVFILVAQIINHALLFLNNPLRTVRGLQFRVWVQKKTLSRTSVNEMTVAFYFYEILFSLFFCCSLHYLTSFQLILLW